MNNPFEVYLNLRPHILLNESLMNNLRTYAFSDRLRLTEGEVIRLGSGTGNSHFSVGRMGNLWLAVREPDEVLPEMAREVCEEYIDNLVKTSQEGKRVSVMIGGIKIETEDSERYVMLLEDFSRRGTAPFVSAKSGEESGTLNGRKVFYDFESSPYFHESTSYMKENRLIIIRNSKPNSANPQ